MTVRLLSFLVLPLLIVLAPLLTGAEPTQRASYLPLAQRKFVAVLRASKEIPPTPSKADGRVTFLLSADQTRLRFQVKVARLHDATLVAIRQGSADSTGDLVALLHGPQRVVGRTTGVLAAGTLTAADLQGPLAGASLTTLVEAMRAQSVYVEVDTAAFPTGEIRGQVHTDRRRPTDL